MKRILTITFVLLILVLPLFPQIPEFWINLLNSIGISSLVVIGLVILTGVAGLTSFGQATFVGLGAYASAYLTTAYGLSPWIGLLAAVIISFLIAWLLGQITLRLSGHYLALGTIAVCLVFYYLYGNMSFLGGHDGLSGLPPIEFFGISLLSARYNYVLICLFVLLAIWVSRNLLNSRNGRAIRSLPNKSGMASSFGVNLFHYKLVAFVFSAVLAGIAGWLYAHEQRAVSPSSFSLHYGIEYLFMAVIGGAGYIWGAVLGTVLVTVLRDQIQDIMPRLFHINGNTEVIVFGVLVILILHYAREGIWPMFCRFFKKDEHHFGGMLSKKVSPLPKKEKPTHGECILEVDKARKAFGGLVAVNDVSFNLKAGQIVGLIGPNGAGKSTTFNLLTGVLPLSSGRVSFMGQDITHLDARQIAELGMARTFQHVQLMSDMTVLENVALGAHLRANSSILQALFHLERKSEAQLLQEAKMQCERVGLGDCLDALAGSLPLGKQRIVEIARALALDPKLLLLDEPAAGLRFKEKEALAQVLVNLRREGLSILLVEHDMDFVMQLTDHIVVVEFGTVIAQGTPKEIQTNPVVLEAYLG
ncbi:branched-chain amino acid ABC transporter ATP-binding protein/permease [Basilea psittacipulmonis]|uniref:ABC transporter domain-containing protein n=1 Tax=Basilea psittacipulmonis DSM 24701 TaxID=1072685 RepID=A0A077DHF2_9BURK|nr:branched-chain amino acid ABC transporter ATP-binding protein/permease [Basilea psittacipulmonis]AIL32957.1 hypothetical protein IX83_06200 [Basilea psittacipulmonis DSM 24701]